MQLVRPGSVSIAGDALPGGGGGAGGPTIPPTMQLPQLPAAACLPQLAQATAHHHHLKNPEQHMCATSGAAKTHVRIGG